MSNMDVVFWASAADCSHGACAREDLIIVKHSELMPDDVRGLDEAYEQSDDGQVVDILRAVSERPAPAPMHDPVVPEDVFRDVVEYTSRKSVPYAGDIESLSTNLSSFDVTYRDGTILRVHMNVETHANRDHAD